VAGLVPDPAFKKRLKDEAWYLGDTYITAIGQGDSLATPLQVARMTAVVANGGDLLRPYLVSKIVGEDGSVKQLNAPTVLRQIATPEQLAVVREGMRGAVEYGTAVELREHPARVSAKTGTAETGDTTRLHAWFTSFAPSDNPKLSSPFWWKVGVRVLRRLYRLLKRSMMSM